jgi:hypothetical protein
MTFIWIPWAKLTHCFVLVGSRPLLECLLIKTNRRMLRFRSIGRQGPSPTRRLSNFEDLCLCRHDHGFLESFHLVFVFVCFTILVLHIQLNVCGVEAALFTCRKFEYTVASRNDNHRTMDVEVNILSTPEGRNTCRLKDRECWNI